MRVSDIALPARVALRPRDDRGYPIPAVVPWEKGRPQFSQSSWERQILVMIEQRCAICALSITDGGSGTVFHVVDDGVIDPLLAELADGEHQVCATTYEAPGHRSCMIYAAVTCAFLSKPTARRRLDITSQFPQMPTLAAGSRRGDRSAVAGFDHCLLRTTKTSFDVELMRPTEIHVYRDGAELLDLLAEAIAEDTPITDEPVRYLGSDNATVIRRLRFHGILDDRDRATRRPPQPGSGRVPPALAGSGRRGS